MNLSFRLALASPDSSLPASDPIDGSPVFQTLGARMWSSAPHIDLGDAGCIIGPLFRREIPSSRVTDLGASERQAIIATGGRALIEQYWGGYIAVLIGTDGTVSVIRDPSGMIPCYVRRDANGITLASAMTALAARGQARIDYDALALMFAGIDTIGRRTGISGIEELLPGECLVWGGAGTHVGQIWSPWDHIQPAKRRSFEEASLSLRATLKDSIGAWSTCFDRILVGVSGGLDSSIVAAALGPRTPRLSCLTMVEPGTDGDERRYAEALVEKLGVRLDAPTYDLGAVDVTRPILPHFPLPYAGHYFHAIEAEHRRLQEEFPIDAFFSGNGGDNVFCGLRSAAPFADQMLAKGIGPALFSTARDIADLTGSGMVDVARKGWSRIRRRHLGHVVRRDLSGLGQAGMAGAMGVDDLHPWLSAPPGTLPGKAAHVAILARAQKSIELYPRESHPPQIAPLLSQPVVELCLSIPTWQWVHAGRDRAVARAAFAGILPDLLVNRTTKGSPSGFVRRVYEAQGHIARELLIDGKLVAAGLIDPDWLAHTADGDWRDDGRDLRLLSFAAAEAWVDWWTSDKPIGA